MSVQYPGLGAYDTPEPHTARKPVEGYDGYTPHTVITPEKARAGRIGGGVLSVLILSTTLAIVGLCAVLATIV